MSAGLIFSLSKSNEMKHLTLSIIVLVSLLIMGCKGVQKSQPVPMGENIGATVSNPNPISMSELMGQLAKKDTVKTQLKAKVEGVCQLKGCWMNLVDTGVDESIFVKFKDYGFFMPLDLAGSNVIVDGIAYREVTSVDELRHYAEDEGKSAEEIARITEPEEELKFMADGVIILK